MQIKQWASSCNELVIKSSFYNTCEKKCSAVSWGTAMLPKWINSLLYTNPIISTVERQTLVAFYAILENALFY